MPSFEIFLMAIMLFFVFGTADGALQVVLAAAAAVVAVAVALVIVIMIFVIGWLFGWFYRKFKLCVVCSLIDSSFTMNDADDG